MAIPKRDKGGIWPHSYMLLPCAFSYKNSLNTILRLEALRYNCLLGRISSSLNLLRRALKGEVIMSFAIEDTFDCVTNREVPDRWKEVRISGHFRSAMLLRGLRNFTLTFSYPMTASCRWTITSKTWQRGCPFSKIGPVMRQKFLTSSGLVDFSSPSHFSPLFSWTSPGKILFDLR